MSNANIHLQLPRQAEPNLSITLGGAGASLTKGAHKFHKWIHAVKPNPLLALTTSPTGLEDGNEFKSTRKNQPLPNINLTASGGLGARDWLINGYYIGTSSEAGSLGYRFKSTGEKQIVVIDSAGAIDKMVVQVRQGQ